MRLRYRSMRPRTTLFLPSTVLLLWSAGFSHLAMAHSMGQAAILLDFHGRTVDAELQLPAARPQSPQITNDIFRNFSASVPGGSSFQVERLDSPRVASIEGAPY